MADADWTWSEIDPGDIAPRVAPVDLVVPTNEQRARLDELAVKLAEAKLDDSMAGGGAAELRAEAEEIEAACTRTFTVRSAGYRRWREMVEEHPSENRMERWNPATFVPAAILECCDQFTTEKQVETAGAVLAHGQIMKLFAAIRGLNEGDDPVPTGRGR